ncbi:MAG: NADH-quinone oxidoreductase subunit N [Ignavibacteria bacterium]
MISASDFSNSIPLIIIGSASLLILILEIILPKSEKNKSENIIFYFSIVSLVIAIYFSFPDLNKNILIYSGFIKITTLTVALNITLLIGVLITVLSSRDYLVGEGINYGEYYSLLFLSLLGMMLMVTANDLIILFIGIELMSVCFYVLAGFMRKRLESNESALKYFLLGAFLTGFLLLGIAFIYGYSGTTNYSTISALKIPKEQFYLLGLALVFITFLFKTGSFPLQMWIPDVYQGSPTIVAGMMSSVGKTAAFGAMLTFFSVFGFNYFSVIVAAVSVLTMVYGNVIALMQLDIKRLLAYSSIAHAGYIMIGYIVVSTSSIHAVMFYLISYILMQLGSFIVVGIVEEKSDIRSTISERTSIESYKGLGKTNPGLAALLSIFLFSLAGIPPFAGFWGKYYIFYAAIQINYVWIAIVGILLSLVGVYYYIKVILYMWFYSPKPETVYQSVNTDFSLTAAVISTLGLFLFGFYPELILRIIRTIS